MLIIEEEHFEQLVRIINEFEKFDFGKKRLIELRNKSVHQIQEYGVDEYMVRQVIQSNRSIKGEYDQLLEELAKSFRKQIKG